MSDPVLSQLVSVEGDLAQQVESLESKLNQLKEQRQGLRTVIGMFQDADAQPSAVSGESAADGNVSVAATADSDSADDTANSDTTADVVETMPEEVAETAPETTSAKSTSAKSTTAKTTAAKTETKAKAKAKPGRKTKASKPATRRKKKDGRAANWQKYVQSEYRDTALPEAVSSVLRSQPSEIFTIADVMSSIFSEDMPRPSFLKARNRISNILSAGARDGTWYRGRNGRYSQSESVTKIK
ncbi:MAG: hypothetical protein WBD47_05040 [Phormidesmis sp.]